MRMRRKSSSPGSRSKPISDSMISALSSLSAISTPVTLRAMELASTCVLEPGRNNITPVLLSDTEFSAIVFPEEQAMRTPASFFSIVLA